MKEAIRKIYNQQENIIPDPEREYQGEDGDWYCKACHKKTILKAKMPDFMGGGHRAVRCSCDCHVDELARLRRQQQEEEDRKRLRELQELSLMGERYKGCSFESLDMERPDSFRYAVSRSQSFCKNHKDVLELGLGLYLYGSNGTGKTTIMACIANDLMSKILRSVLFTSFLDLSKSIRKTYESNSNLTEMSIMKSIASVDFLFIDDIGVERYVNNAADTWLQERVYDIINTRYNAKKPTVFSSNYTMQELIQERGLLRATVDRIFEMSSLTIKIEGDSYRFKNKPTELPY